MLAERHGCQHRQMQTDVGLGEGTGKNVGAAGGRGKAAWASLRRDFVLGFEASVELGSTKGREFLAAGTKC